MYRNQIEIFYSIEEYPVPDSLPRAAEASAEELAIMVSLSGWPDGDVTKVE